MLVIILIMSKIIPIATNLGKELYKKTRNQLSLLCRSVGMSRLGSKAIAINNLIALAEKDPAIQQKIIKYLNPTRQPTHNGPTPTQNSTTTTTSSSDQNNISFELTNEIILDKDQISLQDRVVQKYCKAYENKPLIQIIKNQLIPVDGQYIKTVLIRDLNSTKRKLEELIARKQNPKVKPYRKFYVINDVQNMAQIKNNQPYRNLLKTLQIQTELIYPFHLIQKTHEAIKSNLEKVIATQDLSSLNSYINNELQLRIRMYTNKSSLKYKVYQLSEAMEFMGVIKEQNYNYVDQIVHVVGALLRDDGKIGGRVEFKFSNEVYVIFEKYWQYYQRILEAAGQRVRRKFITKIMEIVKNQSNEQAVGSYFMPNLLNMAVKICKIQVQKLEQNEDFDVILKLSRRTIQSWIIECENKSVYSAQELQLFLQGLKNIDDLIGAIDSKFDTDISTIYNLPEYENITKQVLYSLQNILEQNTAITVIQSNVLNSIINNFQQIFSQSNISTDVISKCVVHGWNLKDKLENRTRRSLIKLLSHREAIGSQVALADIVKDILSIAYDLSVKEVLLAIQLVKNYSLSGHDQIVRNLILCNVDPVELEQNTRNYLKKIAMQRIQNQNIRKQIVAYLQ